MTARPLRLILICSMLAWLPACPGEGTGEPGDGSTGGQDTGAAHEQGAAVDLGPPGLARDGKWKGEHISFTVLVNGTEIWVHDVDYTKCTKGGCEDTAKLENCQTACSVKIKNNAFNIIKHKITGQFTSATTAKGTATEAGDFCGCTLKVDWTSKWVSK